MATYTYDFNGITNPSSTHVATSGIVHGSLSPNFTPPSGTEFSTGNYQGLYASDGTEAASSPSSGIGYFTYQTFKFAIPAGPDLAHLTQIAGSWRGYGIGPDGNGGLSYGSDLYLYNFNSSAWEKEGYNTAGVSTLTFSLTSNPSYYLSSRTLYLCAYVPIASNYNPTSLAFPTLYSDYVSLTLTDPTVTVDIYYF